MRRGVSPRRCLAMCPEISMRAKSWTVPRLFRISRGFTLIELLIVVAIIAVLAAVALPNYLEAHTRAKVSRAKADMRSLATALEMYRVDTNRYPQAEINGTLKYLWQITTPIAYLTNKNLRDPFTPDGPIDITKIYQISTYRYYGFNDQGVLNTYNEDDPERAGHLYSPRGTDEDARIYWYMLFCHGPDRVRNNLKIGSVTGTFILQDNIRDVDRFVNFVYDPTNGTVSLGEIFRPGGEPAGDTAAVARFAEGRR